MTHWAEWGTSIGTLVLAGATFAAVRSSNRTARIAERALLVGLRPVLAVARAHDAAEQVRFADGRLFEVGSGRALVHQEAGVIYLAIPLRNVGTGVAHLHGYRLEPEPASRVASDPLGPARHRRGDTVPELSGFAEQQRDLYIAGGDLGFWQAALRDPVVDAYAAMDDAVRTSGRVTIDLLYGDHEGGQPTITRFVLLPDERDRWRCDLTRHWSLVENERDARTWFGIRRTQPDSLFRQLVNSSE
jgi:hypothetical protein